MVISNTRDLLIDNKHQVVEHCYSVPITMHDIQQKNNICENNESFFIDSGTQTVQVILFILIQLVYMSIIYFKYNFSQLKLMILFLQFQQE